MSKTIQELKLDEIVVIDNKEYQYKGIEKRKDRYAKREYCVFKSLDGKAEKIYSRSFMTTILKTRSDGKHEI